MSAEPTGSLRQDSPANLKKNDIQIRIWQRK
uniref:Uncharacterized protein n=1 Tax=virus sp. ctr1v16 TaxID=2825823 RepID=A0A8S5RQA2_9VIRU|nr:MAG TPA: hypothetical protein [virus sp. ctr1v16]